MSRPLLASTLALLTAAIATGPPPRPAPDSDLPKSADSRLVVELFAAAPDIVHPIAMDVDAKGRLLVVESHTHFRPAKYAGPKHDRVRVLEDTKRTGKADKITTFFEGTDFTMDVAVHPDGSVYVATRNEIIRLRDTDGDGVADEKTRIAFLETAGNYPHNGLSGLSFDARGDLSFGMGENLGANYTLIGADGTRLTGGGEGGNVFHCTAAGGKLRREATGFWNPFGSGRDIFGRFFVVDNDPDASPPCRLVKVVEGGDYGFQFRYGRAGRHVFQAWNGELPGTLPYAAGTGESPCEVIAYESDGLPEDYLGHLLVPVWADHRVERYMPRLQGATVVADRKPFIQGGKEFRPSGLAVAHDGSLFVSDWVSRSYELHGKGAIWHVRWDHAAADTLQPLFGKDRRVREAAARNLANDATGREFLRGQLTSADFRVRAAALQALIVAGDEKLDLAATANADKETGIREMAVRALVARGADTTAFADEKQPATVRAEAIAGLKGRDALPLLLRLLADADPYLRHAAIQRLAHDADSLRAVDLSTLAESKQRIGVLLAHRASGRPDAAAILPTFLSDRDPDVRLIATKWVSDEKLAAYRPQIEAAAKEPNLDPREFVALATTLARLDDKPVNEDSLSSNFVARLLDPAVPASARVMALRGIPMTYAKLKTNQLADLLRNDGTAFRIEILRALKDRTDPAAARAVHDLAADTKQPAAVRAQALVTLGAQGQPDIDFLIGLAGDGDGEIRREAVRSLTHAKLSQKQQAALEAATKDHADCADLVARVLGKPFHSNRPPASDTEAWLKRLEGPADPETGRRVFEHSRLAGCYKCHRVDGRGADVGPDLSLMGRTERRWIVESILQPSAVVAPNFQAWKIDTTDGRSLTGLLVGTYLDESVYVDAKGDKFKVEAREVAETTPARNSIMPDGLLDGLTDQEVRDLVAYLASRK
jgi:putative membrane-bound dehydrogenase-like protein